MFPLQYMHEIVAPSVASCSGASSGSEQSAAETGSFYLATRVSASQTLDYGQGVAGQVIENPSSGIGVPFSSGINVGSVK